MAALDLVIAFCYMAAWGLTPPVKEKSNGRAIVYMTKHATDSATGRRLSDVVTITSAMLAAGVDAYYALGEIDDPEDIVVLIFEAMTTARSRSGARG